MPAFSPFRAVRFAPGVDLGGVIAPPYDVLSEADVAALTGRDPHNIVRLDVPRGGDDRYEIAAASLRAWLAEGVLVRDVRPSYTIYRMSFTDAAGTVRRIVGVLGGLEVMPYGDHGVLPHERVTPKASTDRLDLSRATAANLSPVWGLSLAGGLSEALDEPGEQVGSLTVDGVAHVVERVIEPARIARISQVLAADDVLIADGHHRYGISQQYRDEVRRATGRTDSEAEFTLAFVNELVADQLSVEAIHRVYAGVSLNQLTADLSACFEVTPGPEPSPRLLAEMVELGRLVLVAPDGTTRWLTPRTGAFDRIRSLDGAWLEHALAGSAAVVDYQHGLDELVGRVRSGSVTAGVLIRPTSLAEIQRTAREGLLMPPKSTFFTPKLRTGFVIRPTEPLPGRSSLPA